MRTCFVPLCDVKNKDQPNRTMFLVPKDLTLFAQWAEALPKVRTLRYTDKVCYLHFHPDDIAYTFDHCINGQIYKIKRDRPKLKPDALPCLEMTTNEELLSYRVKPRLTSKTKVVKTSGDATTLPDKAYEVILEENHQRHESEHSYEEVQQQDGQLEKSANIIINFEDDTEQLENYEFSISNEAENQTDDLVVHESKHECMETIFANSDTDSEHISMRKQIDLFNLIYDNAHEVLLPNALWGVHRCPNRSLVCFSSMDVLKMKVTKMICIKTDGSMHLIMDGNIIKSWQLLQDIDDLDSLAIMLDRADKWRICFGQVSNSNCDIIVEPNDDNRRWFTDDNEQMFLCTTCLQIK